MNVKRSYPDNQLLGPRDEFITKNLPLVVSTAQAYRGLAASIGMPMEDVISSGTIGLILAYDRFDNTNVQFSTYGVPYIRGYIDRLFARRDGELQVPQRIVRLARLIARKELTDKPAVEIAETLGVAENLVNDALHALYLRTTAALNDEKSGAQNIGEIDDDTVPQVIEFLTTLPARRRRIVELLMDGYSQSDVARKLGVSRQAVFQSLRQVREAYQNYEEDFKDGKTQRAA